MAWENEVVSRMKVRIQVNNMLKEAIKIKYSELKKAFVEENELKGYDISLVNETKIKINSNEIIVSYADLIAELSANGIGLGFATQENVNNIVENIISFRISRIF